MLEEVLVILLLTILFTFSTVFAYLVRKSLRGGCGQSMYLIWLAVMLAAVIPLQIAPPMVNVIVRANRNRGRAAVPRYASRDHDDCGCSP